MIPIDGVRFTPFIGHLDFVRELVRARRGRLGHGVAISEAHVERLDAGERAAHHPDTDLESIHWKLSRMLVLPCFFVSGVFVASVR